MTYEFLKVATTDNVGWIEYNRPPINTFNHAMLHEMRAALDALIADEATRVVVIASALEKHFSAGAELQLFDGIGSDGMRDWAEYCHGIVGVLRASPKPFLAAIHGAAVGGGLEMTFHCDLRFAAETARIGSPEVNINYLPPIAGTQALARLMGRSKAFDYLYRGELISAGEAHQAGLVDFLCPPETLRAEVAEYAAMLATKPPEALAAIRRCLIDGGARSFEEGLAIELDCVSALAATANFEEGVRAFLDRRPPVWS
ncbi:MAG: enoyl-CoA hydratase/isomerase family protein [Alphaproteobacteria bacterium]|nr:enoyl-CoA hydratase/isomerase family protein [Alphaproteobacteria bacterium]